MSRTGNVEAGVLCGSCTLTLKLPRLMTGVEVESERVSKKLKSSPNKWIDKEVMRNDGDKQGE